MNRILAGWMWWREMTGRCGLGKAGDGSSQRTHTSQELAHQVQRGSSRSFTWREPKLAAGSGPYTGPWPGLNPRNHLRHIQVEQGTCTRLKSSKHCINYF